MKQLLLRLVAIAACVATPAFSATQDRPAGSAFRLVDLTDDYDRVWQEAQKLPESTRASYFEQRWATILPGFYDSNRFRTQGVTPEQYNLHLTRMLAAYGSQRSQILDTARHFGSVFRPAKRKFERS